MITENRSTPPTGRSPEDGPHPVVGESQGKPESQPVLVDGRTAGTLSALCIDMRRMDQGLGEYYQLTWAIRAKMLDEGIKQFLAIHPTGTVVNLGAGVHTSFERTDNGTVQWYDLDLPDVIDLRKRFIPETARSRCIPKSVSDL